MVSCLLEIGHPAPSFPLGDAAAGNGHLSVVKLIHEKALPNAFTTDAMDLAAQLSLAVVQFPNEFRSEGCTTDAMDHAAAVGRLEIVRFLHENRSEGCTTWASPRCKNGLVTVVMHRR
ncbi:hypothetical protein BDK51DRAFT_50295 [Blyttiomyces helicus]|uniref:Ankyrin repeat-containing domain protein n=1 Tax=Blyttiomyces helicus TaxID=388810 RepID=A0A4P9VYT7_9FUNG|nr:hypothetical protein BDK51DRAFT_50295 [Blyttiomyces helicus]|eukprot:RKO83500.1 hypothetical protein BDK51DRAFT_50295 [Blyttiomyces helicus]